MSKQLTFKLSSMFLKYNFIYVCFTRHDLDGITVEKKILKAGLTIDKELCICVFLSSAVVSKALIHS